MRKGAGVGEVIIAC